MFDALKEIAEKIIKIDQSAIVEKVFSNPGFQQQAIDWWQTQMYEDGLDAAGNPLGDYHPATIKQKMEKGQRYDHVTLKDTGDFYDSGKVIVSGSEFYISADTVKPDVDMIKVYPDIMGLNDNSIENTKEVAADIYIEEVTAIIQS